MLPFMDDCSTEELMAMDTWLDRSRVEIYAAHEVTDAAHVLPFFGVYISIPMPAGRRRPGVV